MTKNKKIAAVAGLSMMLNAAAVQASYNANHPLNITSPVMPILNVEDESNCMRVTRDLHRSISERLTQAFTVKKGKNITITGPYSCKLPNEEKKSVLCDSFMKADTDNSDAPVICSTGAIVDTSIPILLKHQR